MSESKDLTISSQGFLAAGKMLNEKFSPLSPLQLEVQDSEDTPPANLLKGGKLRADILPLFRTLAHAGSLGACSYLSANALVDVSFYYPSADAGSTPAVSLSLADDGIRLQAPPDLKGLVEWLAQHLGDSMLRACDLDTELPIEDAYVLFGLVDAARRRALANLGGASSADPEKVVISDVITVLSTKPSEEAETLQWLAPHFAESQGLPALNAEMIEKSIKHLAQKGFLTISGKEAVLSDALVDLASEFLLVNGHLRLRKAECDGSEDTRATEVRGVCGHKHAVLLWTDDGQKVHLLGTSPAQVIVIASDILADPRGIQAQGNKDASEIGQSKKEKEKDRKPRKKNLWWKILLIVLAFLVLTIFMLWFFA